jgi:predicted DNA-binding transcriptional regulator AlpA
MAQGKFPAQVSLGTGRSVGWLDHEVQSWIRDRIATSRAGGGAQ